MTTAQQSRTTQESFNDLVRENPGTLTLNKGNLTEMANGEIITVTADHIVIRSGQKTWAVPVGFYYQLEN